MLKKEYLQWNGYGRGGGLEIWIILDVVYGRPHISKFANDCTSRIVIRVSNGLMVINNFQISKILYFHS